MPVLDTINREFRVAPDRLLKATPVFDTYWRFAAKRQDLFMRRITGSPLPWTDDPILATHRFTNAYRAADRVSQYLIRRVLYEGAQRVEETFFRALLFKFFNRIETWEELVGRLGTPAWKSFNFERYASVLDSMIARGESIYSAAYIMPSPNFGSARKHRKHWTRQFSRNRRNRWCCKPGTVGRVYRSDSTADEEC